MSRTAGRGSAAHRGRAAHRGTAAHRAPAARRGSTEARRRTDAGSAPIEFVFATTVLLVPLVYLVIALAQVQAGAYAAQSTAIDAARQAARQPEGAAARAQALGELHFADHGLESARWTVELSCSGDCARAGSRVTAAVEARVPVPGVPQIWDGAHVPGITVRAEHTDVVSPEES